MEPPSPVPIASPPPSASDLDLDPSAVPLPPDADMRAYNDPPAKVTTPYVAHYPFNDVDLPLSHYWHRPLSLSDLLAAHIFQAYLFPRRHASTASLPPHLLARRPPPVPLLLRDRRADFSTLLSARGQAPRLFDACDALHNLLATEPDTDASPMMEYQGHLWPRDPAKDERFLGKLPSVPKHAGFRVGGCFVNARGWAWEVPGSPVPPHGYRAHLRPFSSINRFTLGDRLVDLLQRYYLEVADPETQAWFETTWEVDARVNDGRARGELRGLSRQGWCDDVSRAAGAPKSLARSNGQGKRTKKMHALALPARQAQQDLFLYSGYSARREPLSDPSAVVGVMHRALVNIRLESDAHNGLTPSTFICHGFQLWEPRLKTRPRKLPNCIHPLTLTYWGGRYVARLLGGRWARTPRGKKRDAFRNVAIAPAAATSEGGGSRGRPRGRSAPVRGEWTSALYSQYDGPVENMFYQPLRLSEMDRRTRRRSLSKRSILDMFHSTPTSSLQTDYVHPPSHPSDPTAARPQPKLPTLPTHLADGIPLDNRKLETPRCGHCGQRGHKTPKCPHPPGARCKCRPFPQHHLAASCPVRCSRACGSRFAPGHPWHSNAMTCKERCCMCGLRGHTGKECRLKRCRCGAMHLGQDCGWNPVCGALLGEDEGKGGKTKHKPQENSPRGDLQQGNRPQEQASLRRCERYLCGVHCRECGSRDKPFVGFRCAKCLSNSAPARPADQNIKRESVFGDWADDVHFHEKLPYAGGEGILRSLAYLHSALQFSLPWPDPAWRGLASSSTSTAVMTDLYLFADMAHEYQPIPPQLSNWIMGRVIGRAVEAWEDEDEEELWVVVD